MYSRTLALYRKGGLNEIVRGVRDWVFHSELSSLLTHVYSKRDLEVNGVSVSFKICNSESFRRSVGHGEKEVIADLISKINPGDVFWDVGANQGTYSLFASNVGAISHSFEPNPKACRIIRENARLNDVDVSIHQLALGTKDETMILRDADRSGKRWIAANGTGIEVSVRRGDNLDIEKPDILKIDVEGAELDVLDGFRNHLSDCRICYVEYHGGNKERVQTILSKFGFEVTEISGNVIRGHRA